MSTLYFPQLAVGSAAQYPVTREWSKPAVINILPGGSTILMARVTPAHVLWKLSYTGLSDLEWGALQTLFAAVQGRLGNFTFIDPTDNLLSWSEDFTAAAWTVDPLLQIVAAVPDPFGGTAASQLTNVAQAAQQMTQSLAGPGWNQYCFSIYLRADSPSTVNLIRSTASATARQAVAVGSNWARVTTSGSLGGQDDGVRFGIELAAGIRVFVFGPQVEAQPSAGPYKSKGQRSGVYPKTRFDQDILTQTASAAGQYSTTIQVTSNY
jgi:hypothetical protein